MERTVKAYEDNAGGLTMVILEGGEPVYAGITDEPSASLRDDIIAALTYGDLYSWGSWYDNEGNSNGDRNPDGSLITAEDIYDECRRIGCRLIAEASSLSDINIYPERMGLAAEAWMRHDDADA